jgi:protein LSM12
MERQMQSRGVGVSARAQRLFDNLSKTMPCKWDGTTIEVFESVHIADPYTTSNCVFKAESDENATVMERVQAVLGEEVKKLDAEEAEAAAAEQAGDSEAR